MLCCSTDKGEQCCAFLVNVSSLHLLTLLRRIAAFMHLLKLVFSVFILWMADKYFPLSVLFIC